MRDRRMDTLASTKVSVAKGLDHQLNTKLTRNTKACNIQVPSQLLSKLCPCHKKILTEYPLMLYLHLKVD